MDNEQLVMNPPQQPPMPQSQPAMGAQLEPQTPPGVGQPATTQEFQERKSGWQQFAERLRSDPATQQMVLGIGLRMMQPIQAGQSGAGHVAAAVGDALHYNNQWQMQQKEEARKQAVADQAARQSNETIATSQQSRDFNRQRFPTQLAGDQLQQQTAQQQLQIAQANLARIRAEDAAGLHSPETLVRHQKAEEDLKQAQIALAKAQTGLATAHGNAYTSLAEGTRPGTGGTHQLVKSDDQPDGSTIQTILVNGREQYRHIQPAMSPAEAQKVAKEAVTVAWRAAGKSIPFFTGWDAEFTKAVNEKAQTLTQPRVTMLNGGGGDPSQGGQSVVNLTAKPPNASRTDMQISPEEMQGRDAKAISLMQRELAALPPGPSNERAAIERDIANLKAPAKGDPKPISEPIAKQPTVQFARNQDGQIVRVGAPTGNTPATGSKLPQLVDSGTLNLPGRIGQSLGVRGKPMEERAAREAAGKARDSVAALREILKLGRYTPEEEGVIAAAVKTGQLTPDEMVLAKQLLRQIDARNGVDGGTRRVAE